jgi:hypothetical protein
MNTHRFIITTTVAAAAVAVGFGIAVAPAAHADRQDTIAADYINRLSAANMDMSSAKQREVALLGGILSCQLDALGGAPSAGSEQYLAAAKSSGWCGLAAADATGLSAASSSLSESIVALPAPSSGLSGCGPADWNGVSVCPPAPGAGSASSSCPAGFYPTDTSGVCVDTPPEARPPHVATSDLPGPIFDIVEGGNQTAVQSQFDDDKDGYNNAVDLAPSDPSYQLAGRLL